MDARTKQRQEELALYRSRPDLVEPDLVFQPSINRSVPSTSRRISPVRSPMRRAEGRHLEQMAAARERTASLRQDSWLGSKARRPRLRPTSPVLMPDDVDGAETLETEAELELEMEEVEVGLTLYFLPLVVL